MPANLVAGRYELRELLGEGGMGVVYRAVDTRTGGLVAIKTMRDVSDARNLEMFKKEWRVLARLSHPNIVDIRDVDEIEEDGVRKPCFVMPLLPGVTLADLIKQSSSRLTVARVVSIISQVCSGLEAAHRCDLIHRDLKPSNIFVMEDDNAKIIDFGLVHDAEARSVTGYKGTWQYMAPEQTEGRTPTVQTDIFSLGVVAYEALTGRKPFSRKTVEDTVDAIRNYSPPSISEINPKISQIVSKVIHKSMAKQAMQRYSSAKEFAETLQKAWRNEPIERFDPAKILPRIERARNAFRRDDSAFASEILTELEAEGNVDPEITLLRAQIEESVKQKRIRQLFESAQTRLEQDETPLALDKLREILALDPENGEARLMRKRIEEQRNNQQISDWMKLAQQHVALHDFQEARQALKEVLNIRYDDPDALRLLSDIDVQETEAKKARSEKEQLYGSALKAYQGGEISAALSKLEKILEVSRRAPGATVPEREAVYQSFYNRVRSERDTIDKAYEDGRRFLNDKEFQKAIEICDNMLATYPASAQFQALKLRVEQAERQELSAFIAEVGRAVDGEPDLDRRRNILEEALKRYPNEAQFQQLLRLVREQRDLVQSILTKARQYEEQGQLGDAVAQWKILKNIHPQYPGIEFEISQLEKRHEQQTTDEAKSRVIEQIDRAIENGSFAKAVQLVQNLLADFPQDAELAVLERMARQGLERVREAETKFDEARNARAQGRIEDALALLRGALSLDQHNQGIRSALVSLLVENSQARLDTDWRDSEQMAQAAAELDPQHPAVKRLTSLIAEAKRRDVVNRCVAEARKLQLSGDVPGAITRVSDGLSFYPTEPKLKQFQASLQNSLQAAPKGQKIAEADAEPGSPSLLPANKITQETVAVAEKQAVAAAASASGFIPHSVAESRFEPASAFDSLLALPATPPKPLTVTSDAAPLGSKLRRFMEIALNVTRSLLIRFPASRLLQPKMLGLALSFLALLFAGIFWLHDRTTKPKTAPVPAYRMAHASGTIRVPVKLTPPDAQLMIDDKPQTPGELTLNPALSYKVKVSRVGFQPILEPTLQANSKGWDFVLKPEPLLLQVATGEHTAKVLLDGHEIGNFQQADEVIYELAPDGARHLLAAKNRAGELFRVEFVASAGRLASVLPLSSPDLVVASTLGSDALLFSGNPGSSFVLPGGKPEEIQKAGTQLAVPASDSEQFVLPIVDSKHRQNFTFIHSNAPAISISLNANANLASLSITASVDSAQLFLDGRERKTRKPGIWRLYGLQPGPHELRLVAAGYADETQTIQLEKSQTLTQTVVLKAASATLVIAGSTPGARLLIDSTSVGSLDATGSLRLTVSPGVHQIQLQKEDYEAVALQKPFTGGQTLELQSGELTMKPFASLSFEVLPVTATIQYRRAEESEWHSVSSPSTVRVKSGNYDIRASAESYVSESRLLFLASGEKTKVTFDLHKPIIHKAQVLTPGWFQHSSDIASAGNDWFTGTSAGFLALKSIRSATFTFLNPERVPIKHKGKKVEWRVTCFPDGQVDYELDGQQLTRRVKWNGKSSKVSTRMDIFNGQPFYTFRINFEPHHIVIVSKTGMVLDDLSDIEHDLSQATASLRGDQYFVLSER